MKKKLASLALAATAAFALFSPAPLWAQVSVPAEAAEGGRLWFVELIGAPSIEGRAAAAVRAEHAAFRAAAAAAGLKFSERRAYSSLFNGLAIAIEPKDRLKFARLSGVKAMHAIETVQAPSPEEAAGSAIDLATALSLTGADIAQNTLGLAGRGVKVGVIDTGIDIDHPAFGGGGVPGGTAFPSARIVAGHDFVGDAFNAAGSGAALVPVPDDNPDDCNGHGTHVAGIVGGNGGGIKGVAPEVKFGAYRVFGCTGSTTSDIILAALEQAHADGMKVINQSLGAARQWPQYPTAQASSRLVNKGIVMVASIGNNGPGGSSPDALFAAGAPGVGKNVIGVASFDNAQRAFLVNGTPFGYTPASAAPLPPTSGSLPMSKTGTPASTADACSALPAGSLAGSAALVRRGGCTFHTKALNAMNAGAAAVVLYNNGPGALNATVAGTPAITIPVVGITAAQGATLDAAIAAGATTLNWSTEVVSFPFGTGGLISGFSSFGLAADLSIKPDIGAPGGGIFSSYPLELGGGATLSGTSMSSPHVAGLAALMLESNPRLKPAAIQARLQGTAQPKPWAGNPGLGFLDHVHRQGAGMANVVAAVQTTFTATPNEIALHDDDPRYHKEFTIQVVNSGRNWVDWTISHEPALATGPNTQTGATYAVSGVFLAPANVTLSNTTATSPPRGGVAMVAVTFASPDSLPERSLYGGYIVFRSTDGQHVVRVPYGGMKGDYQSTQVLTPTANGFPWLASLSGGFFFNQPAGATYTMVGDDIPFILAHFDHLSRRLKIEVFDAISGRAWHNIALEQYMTRNSTPGGFFAFAWDGITFRGNGTRPEQYLEVPNGQYVVKITVLKALGEDDQIWVPEHTESWTSPVITIARP